MKLILYFTLFLFSLFADNQTEELSPIQDGNELPFNIRIEEESFQLPNGLHSYAYGVYKGKWLFIAGRTNGLHGFNNDPNNFPPPAQNKVVYVVDPISGTTYSKSLTDPSSGLTEHQIDLLSVTSPQSYQKKNTLYITGGYGVDTNTGLFSTKDALTAIDLAGLIDWVLNPAPKKPAAASIRQIFDPVFQVTGGAMYPGNHGTTLLIFGQNFQGYYSGSSNGEYTRQVRRFKIKDDGEKLSVKIKSPIPKVPEEIFRRRDLNVVPTVHALMHVPIPSYVALSGVFTESGGGWTVPVEINYSGSPSMQDPMLSSTFKQGMNNYTCPTVEMFSMKEEKMYIAILGGISYEYYQNGSFQTDDELPFINQLTTISIDNRNHYTQYLMSNEYPVILSTESNPGNPLLFGAGGAFIPSEEISTYINGILQYDKLKKGETLIGWIIGGIESTLPNTNTMSDSAASPYIFRVVLEKK